MPILSLLSSSEHCYPSDFFPYKKNTGGRGHFLKICFRHSSRVSADFLCLIYYNYKQFDLVNDFLLLYLCLIYYNYTQFDLETTSYYYTDVVIAKLINIIEMNSC